MSATDILKKIIDLDEQIATLKEEFDAQSENEKAEVLEQRLAGLQAEDFNKDDVPLALARCLDMIGGLGDDHAVRILARGMQHENADVRDLCGQVIYMLSEEGIAAIMPAVEIALEKGGILAEELPYLLAEIEDPEAPRLIERFLKHDEAPVVLSSIEALLDCGDELTIDALKQLEGDKREITLEEEGKPADKTTLGAIVTDALGLFESEKE